MKKVTDPCWTSISTLIDTATGGPRKMISSKSNEWGCMEGKRNGVLQGGSKRWLCCGLICKQLTWVFTPTFFQLLYTKFFKEESTLICRRIHLYSKCPSSKTRHIFLLKVNIWTDYWIFKIWLIILIKKYLYHLDFLSFDVQMWSKIHWMNIFFLNAYN